MPHAVALHVEVADVEVAESNHEWHETVDADAVFGELSFLFRVIRQQANGFHAHVFEHSRRRRVIACIGGEAEGEIRIEGVKAFFLKAIGLELVDQADASTFVSPHVQNNPTIARDCAQGLV